MEWPSLRAAIHWGQLWALDTSTSQPRTGTQWLPRWLEGQLPQSQSGMLPWACCRLPKLGSICWEHGASISGSYRHWNNMPESGQWLIFQKKSTSILHFSFTLDSFWRIHISKFPASKEDEGKSSVCLDHLEKTMGKREGCFAGHIIAKLEGHFASIKSWSTMFSYKIWHSNEPLPENERNREENFTMIFKAETQCFVLWETLSTPSCAIQGMAMEPATHFYCGWLRGSTVLLPRCKGMRRGKDTGGGEGEEGVKDNSRTLHWHLNKLESKQNCSCLYKQLDCTLTEYEGMKPCPYKVTLIFTYLTQRNTGEGQRLLKEKYPSVKAGEMENKI